MAVTVAPFVSVTVTVKVVVVSVEVGVPEIVPVEVLKIRPVGNVPVVMLYVRVPVPPLPVTGVKLVMAWFCVKAVEATTVAAVTAAFTARLKLAVAVAPFASVTVTVKLVAVSVAVGIPIMAPVKVLKLNPVGSVPIVIA